MTLPDGDGGAGQLLSTNGAGFLSWVSGASPTGAAAGDLAGSYPAPSLTTTGVVAGTYPKVVVDAKGRVQLGTALVAADVPNLPASVITTGKLDVSVGGTGSSSFTNNGVIIGNNAGNLLSTAAGSGYQVLRVPSGGGMPAFGALDVSQTSAVTGVLNTANGGTGQNSTAVFPTSGTVVTREATESMVNKTISNSTITTSLINGSSTIGGATVVDTSGTITSGAANINGDITIRGNNTIANKAVFSDSTNTFTIGVKSPDTLPSSFILTLPNNAGGAGQLLTSDGSGGLSWVTGAAPRGPASGDLTGTYPSPYLTATGVIAGQYTKVTVDTKGRITAGTGLVSTDIPSLPASIIGNGILPVTVGGTGSNTFTNKGVILGNTTGNLYSTAAGSAFQSLTVPSNGGSPYFSAVDLSQAAATTGVLPTNRGGTGVNSDAVYPSTGTVLTAEATQTLSNKTLMSPVITAGTVGGASRITDSTVIDTTGTINAGATTISGDITIRGNNTIARRLVFNDAGSVNSVAFKAPDTVGTSVTWTLPNGDGTTGQLLRTDGSGTLSWVSGAAPTGAAYGDLTGSYPSPQLTTTGVTAGTFQKVAVDAKGRIYYGTSLAVTDVPSLPTSIIGSGVFSVPFGGTGSSSFTENGVILGNSTNNLFSTAAGTSWQVLTVPSGGGAPRFGPINLSQNAAVSGVLSTAFGGTGVSGTAVFPQAGVVVTRSDAETLSNKTLSSPLITAGTMNGASLITGSTMISTTGTISTGAATMASSVTIQGNGTLAGKLVINDKGTQNYIGLQRSSDRCNQPRLHRYS